jgi:hypothetical protein
MSHRLKDVQNLLYRLITAPSGVSEGLADERELPRGGLDAVIRGDERLSAEDRVDIYANMYFYRLLEVLNEDYPAIAAVLGQTNFHNLITGYLLEYRPTEPSVTWAGRYLADFLRDHPLRADFPFAADLAQLERATVDVFFAPDDRVLEASEMNAIAPGRWAAVKMKRIAATALLTAEWKVAEVLRAVEEKQPWEPPAAALNRILVWRRNSMVSYREVVEKEFDALTLLGRATTFGKVCEILSRDVSEEQAPLEISQALARWLADGILTRPAAKSR